MDNKMSSDESEQSESEQSESEQKDVSSSESDYNISSSDSDEENIYEMEETLKNTLKNLHNKLRRYLFKRVYENVMHKYQSFKGKDTDFIAVLKEDVEYFEGSNDAASEFTKNSLKYVINELKIVVKNSRSISVYLKNRIKCYRQLRSIKSSDTIVKEIEKCKDKIKTLKFVTKWNTFIGNTYDLTHDFNSLTEQEKDTCIKSLSKTISESNHHMVLNILRLNTTTQNKTAILNFMKSNLRSNSGKREEWLETVCKIPFGKVVELKHEDPKKVLNNSLQYMNDSIYGHQKAKRAVLRILAQELSNKKTENGSIIALSGPPGIGKTTLIKNGISKALGRPFHLVSLGGISDASYLEGHSFTWEGSVWGKVVDVLLQSKCMNPVILFDEVDKISETSRGNEIVGKLIHIIDKTQNMQYQDKYFSGIDIDLSKVTFMFSLNYTHKLDRILKDRMKIIPLDAFSLPNKVGIVYHSLWQSVLDEVGMGDLEISNSVVEYIIKTYTCEAGVRRLREILLEIVQELNLRRLEKRRRTSKGQKRRLTKSIIQDILKGRHKVEPTRIRKNPQVGVINGLWANDMGMGGILPIQVKTVPSKKKISLLLTGNQGKVMRESMHCAATLAWNMLSSCEKSKWVKRWNKRGMSGFHIHCPDNATPKDGPSAGAAITMCILSVLTGCPIASDIAMTGEISLSGHVGKIGGLHEKLRGAKEAGVKVVLIPESNMQDFKRIVAKDLGLIKRRKFEVFPVKTITDVLRYVMPNENAIDKTFVVKN